MDVILLEKVGKMGNLGAVIKVRGGYGRNFLIPQGKALPATKGNMAKFEKERAAFEQRQQTIKQEAEELATKICDLKVVIDRPAGSSDKLFGSVTNADIADFFKKKGVDIPRRLIDVVQPIRTLGNHTVFLRLHPDVSPAITVLVERSVK